MPHLPLVRPARQVVLGGDHGEVHASVVRGVPTRRGGLGWGWGLGLPRAGPSRPSGHARGGDDRKVHAAVLE